MKNKIAALLTIVPLLLCSAACSPRDGADDGEKEKQYEYVSVLNDRNFRNGFEVNGIWNPIYGDPEEDAVERYDLDNFGQKYYHGADYFDYDKGLQGPPSWTIHQAASRYPWHDRGNTVTELKDGKQTFNYKFTDLGDERYLYQNQSKELEVDTKTSEFRLALKSSECYKYDRAPMQEWPHLLLMQSMGTPEDIPKQIAVKNTESIVVSLDLKLNSFADRMQGTPNPDLHACVLMFYLEFYYMPSVAQGFTDFFYVGLTLFDNRTPFAVGTSGPDSGTKESETNKWVYNISGTHYWSPTNNLYDMKGNLIFDEWKSIDFEVYPYISLALGDAQRGDMFQGVTMDKLYLHHMYIGFESPGTYDVDMSFRNLDIQSYIEV